MLWAVSCQKIASLLSGACADIVSPAYRAPVHCPLSTLPPSSTTPAHCLIQKLDLSFLSHFASYLKKIVQKKKWPRQHHPPCTHCQKLDLSFLSILSLVWKSCPERLSCLVNTPPPPARVFGTRLSRVDFLCVGCSRVCTRRAAELKVWFRFPFLTLSVWFQEQRVSFLWNLVN